MGVRAILGRAENRWNNNNDVLWSSLTSEKQMERLIIEQQLSEAINRSFRLDEELLAYKIEYDQKKKDLVEMIYMYENAVGRMK
jgi:hypothetical protein